METRLLEYFVTVADERSVTRASERLFAAQSTVSAGLRSLETDLGVRLFERTSKSVRLLPAGETLLPLARALLDDLDGMRRVATESATGLRGRVRVGVFSALQVFDLPGALGRFRSRNPLVDVQLMASPTGSTGLLDDLAHGRLDLAFTAVPPPPELDSWPVARYEFVVLLAPGHRLAGAAAVSLEALAAEDWVDVLPGFGNRVQLDRALAERGIVRHIAAELADLPSVPLCVAAGLGVAVVPDAVDPGECVRLPLAEPMPPWVLSLAARHGADRRAHIRALLDELRSVAVG
ncbi:LysR family transcriptional regulator [Herbiconiux moechotypicola]|uniref:LysR family transcriptional regulator n=1 Tax=Herbiconiux moechotypicola TaxID=637393 RepID=A0ABP5QVE7_9MICO|nr:LysR family transcriptional regulator [Herbiconiux moechotypicola]MCS5730738.1 LysR family transcriptional regulator [Herbiconiux moechotypicola]